ncbi:MAG: hypothetical protein ACK5Q5_02620 [Planctomycetaceae bacterium]
MVCRSQFCRLIYVGLLAILLANAGCQVLSGSRGLPAQWEPNVESAP